MWGESGDAVMLSRGRGEQVEVKAIAATGPVDEFQLVDTRSVSNCVGEPGIWVKGDSTIGGSKLYWPQG